MHYDEVMFLLAYALGLATALLIWSGFQCKKIL